MGLAFMFVTELLLTYYPFIYLSLSSLMPLLLASASCCVFSVLVVIYMSSLSLD